MPAPDRSTSSIDAEDVARFSAIADEWWDAHGKFAPLHRINPTRLAFIRERALTRFARPARARAPFTGLRLLDIGCGGGLMCEPMARLGFSVVGVDASHENIGVAATHAGHQCLEIDYRATTAESLLDAAERPFDVILNMEVVEHVADPGAFLRDCARLLAPGGIMFIASLNRTIKAFAQAKIAAEYLLAWLPRGTHDWRKFVTPAEIRRHLASEAVDVDGPFGMVPAMLDGAWTMSRDASVNYFMTCTRARTD